MISDELDKEYYSYDDICPECGALYAIEGPGKNCYYSEGCGLVRPVEDEEFMQEYDDEGEEEEYFDDY